MTSRREFLKTAVTGATLMLQRPGVASAAWQAAGAPASRAPRPLDILILGGTGFIGPHLVRAASGRGHRITTFTRGRHAADLPSAVVQLHGDRNGQLDALRGHRWDAVVDDSATNPDWVTSSAELLRGSVGRYLFTSSTGVYYPYLTRDITESGPVRTVLDDPRDGSAAYGVNKARCEAEVHRVFGDRGLVVRPGYIVGPGDTTDRFPYWPVRMARGGDVLAPGRPDDPAQWVDVRDLVAFMLLLLEAERSGTFNVVGPRAIVTARAFYETARATLNPVARLTFIDDYDFLRAHHIVVAIPWALLAGNDAGMMSISNAKAAAAGLTLRPVQETLRDTLAWWPTVPEDRRANPHFAITPAQEAAALADWRARGR